MAEEPVIIKNVMESCRETFKKRKFFTVTGVYMWEIVCFVCRHLQLLTKNNPNHLY